MTNKQSLKKHIKTNARLWASSAAVLAVYNTGMNWIKEIEKQFLNIESVQM